MSYGTGGAVRAAAFKSFLVATVQYRNIYRLILPKFKSEIFGQELVAKSQCGSLQGSTNVDYLKYEATPVRELSMIKLTLTRKNGKESMARVR
jgi:hypothetical protein